MSKKKEEVVAPNSNNNVGLRNNYLKYQPGYVDVSKFLV